MPTSVYHQGQNAGEVLKAAFFKSGIKTARVSELNQLAYTLFAKAL
ncbi:MAG: hypothetical protein KJ731_00535 [Alphaproteobacteria bacterium]|jgi:hypothetical protein|nr:hypothetical protein [Alphaproteobacteria bacterium]